MKKKIKSNFFNEFKEKVLSGGDYAYVYDKEDSSLTDAAFNAFSDFDINDIKDWKTTDTAPTTNVSANINGINGWKDSWTTTTTSDKTITITGGGAGAGTGGGAGTSGDIGATWVYPYYPTTGTVTTTSATVTIPYYSEETFEDEEESFYIVCDTFEESEEISPKRKFSDGAKEICFSMIAVPSKRMKNNGVKFPVCFYTPKKRIKEGEKIPSGNYFYHDNIMWKKCYSKKMGYDEFFKFVETHF